MEYITYSEELYQKSNYNNNKILLNTINQILKWVEISRQHGILEIEDDVENLDGFYADLFKMFTDGVLPEVIFKIGLEEIEKSKKIGVELRNMMIFNAGMVLLSRGEPISITSNILYKIMEKK